MRRDDRLIVAAVALLMDLQIQIAGKSDQIKLDEKKNEIDNFISDKHIVLSILTQRARLHHHIQYNMHLIIGKKTYLSL